MGGIFFLRDDFYGDYSHFFLFFLSLSCIEISKGWYLLSCFNQGNDNFFLDFPSLYSHSLSLFLLFLRLHFLLLFFHLKEIRTRYEHSVLIKILVGNLSAGPRTISFIHCKYQILVLFLIFLGSFSINIFLFPLLLLNYLQRKCTEQHLP